MTTLKPAQFTEEGLTDWVWLVRGIEARYETGGFATGLELVNRIGAAAEEANHHPDLTLTWPTVHVSLFSHDVGAVTERDVELARTISGIARDLGVTPTPEKLTKLEWALDTADKPAAVRFWAAVLGYDVVPGGDEAWAACTDPGGRRPRLFFQRVPEGKTVKNRLHLDVRVGTGLVGEERLAALEAEAARLEALGATRGQLLLADEENESCQNMRDVEGNEFCLD